MPSRQMLALLVLFLAPLSPLLVASEQEVEEQWDARKAEEQAIEGARETRKTLQEILDELDVEAIVSEALTTARVAIDAARIDEQTRKIVQDLDIERIVREAKQEAEAALEDARLEERIREALAEIDEEAIRKEVREALEEAHESLERARKETEELP